MSVRRSIGLHEDDCTACLICVRECPSQCMEIDRHSEQISEGRRPKTVHILDAFNIDFALCMFCGLCIDVCPTDALQWSDLGGLAAHQREGLVSDSADLVLRGRE